MPELRVGRPIIPGNPGFNPGARIRTVSCVSEYLVEAYVSRDGVIDLRSVGISDMAEELTREGREVHLLRSIFVPADETCFLLFEAESGAYVMEAAIRSGMQVERVMDAVSIPESEGAK